MSADDQTGVFQLLNEASLPRVRDVFSDGSNCGWNICNSTAALQCPGLHAADALFCLYTSCFEMGRNSAGVRATGEALCKIDKPAVLQVQWWCPCKSETLTCLKCTVFYVIMWYHLRWDAQDASCPLTPKLSSDVWPRCLWETHVCKNGRGPSCVMTNVQSALVMGCPGLPEVGVSLVGCLVLAELFRV